jgi:autotransporter-associated beta strand protein
MRIFIATVILSLVTVSAPGVTQTWSGAGTNAYWSTPENWANGVAPATNDSLLFAGSAVANTNDFPAGTLIGGLLFSTNAAAFTLNGNGLILGGNVTDSATAVQKVNLALGLGNAGRIFSVVTNGQLTVCQPLAGTPGFVKDGPGTLTFNATNTYAGATTISNGTVRLEPSLIGSPVPGMLYWLDAADLATLTLDASNRVSQWSDKSGNSLHFLQALAARRPLLVANALGSKPVLRFDGVTNRLVLGNST